MCPVAPGIPTDGGLGGQVKVGGLQGALAVAPGVWLYQLTDTGLALVLTATPR